MPKFRIVKQYQTGSNAVWISKVTDSEPTLEYTNEATAYRKMIELEDADSTGRKYKVVEI